MFRGRISTRVPDSYAQRVHKGQSMHVRRSKFLVSSKVPKKAQFSKIAIDTNKWCQKLKKILLKIRLNMHIKNFSPEINPHIIFF